MSRRRSIEIEGFSHGGLPIPAACRIENVIMTSGIFGMDVATGKVPDDIAEQARNLFANLARILEAGGSGLQDVIKMTFHVKALEARSAINAEWLRAFPDARTRPARQTFPNEHLQANIVIQCDVTAILETP